MAGLLDVFDDPGAQLGMGLLAAASPRADGAGFGQRLMEVVQSAQGMQKAKMQQQLYQMQFDEMQRRQAQEKKIAEGIGQFFKPGQAAVPAFTPMAGSPLAPMDGRPAVAPTIDAQGMAAFLAQNGDHKGALDVLEKFKPQPVKLKNVEQMKDPQTGRLVNVAMYENGETRVLPFGVKPDMQILSLGDRQQAVDKNAITPGATFQMGQSPDSKANTDVSWANYNLSRERFNFDKAGGADANKPVWNAETNSWMYRPDAQNPTGRVVQVAGMPEKPMTDSQSKANLFGTRALEAEKAIQSMSGKADRPGWIKRTAESTVGLVPFAGDKLADVAGSTLNWTQSDAQQQVEQAQRDFINAVMRRESGAVIGPAEFVNANKQYFPQVGDSEAVLAQKARNRKTAIEGVLAEVPSSRRPVVDVGTNVYSDPEKERRYQEWLRKNKG